MIEGNEEWKCQLCGKRPANSREHLPPKSTRNSGKVYINFVDVSNNEAGFQRRQVISDDGFWVPALCKRCNHKTGGQYGDSYAKMVTQVSKSAGFIGRQGYALVRLEQIYPLRILKQMYSMFICSLPHRPDHRWEGIRNFVLKRNAKLPQDAPRIFLYKNISGVGRIVPWCAVSELFTRRKPLAICEISWPPVGIVFADRMDGRLSHLEDITAWGSFEFGDKINAMLELPQLRVNVHHPLGFGTAKQVDEWRTKNGVIWILAAYDKKNSPNSTSMLWKKS